MTNSLTGNNNFPKSFGDSRDDLGYGRLTPKYFKHRVHGDPTFPYSEDPLDLEDVDMDEETVDAVVNKLATPRNYDPLPFYDTEGQSFTGPAAKLGEASNTMHPIPDLYKNRSRSPMGGTAPKYPQGPADGFSSRIRPTGDRYGYSTMYGETEEGDEPAYTLEDIAEKQIEEIRHFVRLVLMENQWD
tara:strand:- start:125 stop:685 length:561 start_codon:yes stop_codon:yes gene_type:complete